MKKLQRTERYLIWCTDLLKYSLRRCADHGVYTVLKPRPDDCPFCHKEGAEVENIEELKKQFQKEFENI